MEEESDDDDSGNPMSRAKKARADAVQSARQAEQREKDKERQKARAEAAGRRQERAGRRRGDGEIVQPITKATSLADQCPEADPSETPKPTNRPSPPPSSQPESPPASSAPEKLSHKKGAAPGKRVKKLGNNQYTKHRVEAPTSAGITSSPHSKKRQLAHTAQSSSDEQHQPNGDAPASGTPDNQPGHPKGGKWAKGSKKNAHLNGVLAAAGAGKEQVDRSIPNMARALEGMAAFIAKAQMEVAADRARLGDSSGSGSGSERSGVGGRQDAMEMAENLSRGIREWQERFLRGEGEGGVSASTSAT